MKKDPKAKGTLRTKQYQAAQNTDDATHLIKLLGEKRREILRIEADMNDEISTIKQRYETQAQPLKVEVAEIIDATQAWAEVNRDELTNNGKTKTVKLATGEFNWRMRPPKVSLRGKPKIMETMKALGLQRFLRTSEDIDKESLLKEQQAVSGITGITIGSAGEDFSINPYETQIEGKK